MNMKKFLWIIPFLSFLGGYLVMSFIYQPKSVKTPRLIGTSVQQALSLATAQGLSLRMIDEKEDPDIPEGTVLAQNPLPNTRVKIHQAIACTISKKPELKAPNLIGMSEDSIACERTLQKFGYTVYYVPSQSPVGVCVAQDPMLGLSMSPKKMIVYISQGAGRYYIFPDFRRMGVDEVKNLLAHKPCTVNVVHILNQPEDHVCTQCIVSDQRPRPGTIIQCDEQQPIVVQLIATPVIDAHA
jgi:beta-lactam-binding protein with PASTA domain